MLHEMILIAVPLLPFFVISATSHTNHFEFNSVSSQNDLSEKSSFTYLPSITPYYARLCVAHTGDTWTTYLNEVVSWEQSNDRIKTRTKSDADLQSKMKIKQQRRAGKRRNNSDDIKKISPRAKEDESQVQKSPRKDCDQSLKEAPETPSFDDEFHVFVRLCNILLPVDIYEARQAIVHKRRRLLKLSKEKTIKTIAMSEAASIKVIKLIEHNLFANIEDFRLPLHIGQSIFTYEDPTWIIMEHVYFVLYKIIETCTEAENTRMYHVLERENLHLRMFELMRSPDQRERKSATKVLTQFYTHHKSMRIPIIKEMQTWLQECVQNFQDLIEKRPIDSLLFLYTFVLKRLEDSHKSILVQIFKKGILPIFKLPIFYDYYPSWKNIFLDFYQQFMQAELPIRMETVNYLLKNAFLPIYTNQYAERVRIEFLLELLHHEALKDNDSYCLFNVILKYGRERARPRMAFWIAEIMRDDVICQKFQHPANMFNQTKVYIEAVTMICAHLLGWYIDLEEESEGYKDLVQGELFKDIFAWKSKIEMLQRPSMVALREDSFKLEELWTRFCDIVTRPKSKLTSSPSSPFPNLRYAGKTPEQIIALANERIKTLRALEIRRYDGSGITEGEIDSSDNDPMEESVIDFRPDQNNLPNTFPDLAESETFPLHHSWTMEDDMGDIKDLADLFNSNL